MLDAANRFLIDGIAGSVGNGRIALPYARSGVADASWT